MPVREKWGTGTPGHTERRPKRAGEEGIGAGGNPEPRRSGPGPGFADRQPRVPLEKKRTNYRLRQDVETLRDRVTELKREREERYQAVPGLSRLTVIEMVADPQAQPGEAEVREPDDGVATPDETPDPAGSGEPLIASNQFNFRLQTETLSNALTTGLVGLGYLDSQVFSDSIFVRGVPGVEFSAETTGANPEQDLAPSPSPDEDPGSPAIGSEPQRPASAYTIYDETTGNGSILVQNLPPAEQGTRYQLWMIDSLDPQPVNVGGLPELENGGGQVFFELGEGGYSPSQFFLTQEAEDGSDVPAGKPVLFGPRGDRPPRTRDD